MLYNFDLKAGDIVSEDLITIGQITKFQGNKGEVRVFPLTDDPERFKLLEEVFLTGDLLPFGPKKMIIESLYIHKQFVVIKFEGVEDIESAEELKNCFIQIPEEEVMELPEDNYYIYNIIGILAYTSSGRKLGKLKEVLQTGGTDIFVIAGEEKEYLIPATREIITELNEKEEYLVVDPIPGLLDL